MIDAEYFLGYPKKCKNGLYTIYPPKVKDLLENDKFFTYKSLLTISQEDIEDQYREQEKPIDVLPTPFEYILDIATQNEESKALVSEAFNTFLHEGATFLKEKKMIIIGNLEEVLPKLKSIGDLRILTEENYLDFQNDIRGSMGEESKKPMDLNQNMKIRNMKAKARYRDRVAAKQKGTGLTFGSTLAVICCMDFGISPLNIGELSYAAIPILMRYYQEKKKYDIDIESLLNGADSKKVKLQTWIRNIEE